MAIHHPAARLGAARHGRQLARVPMARRLGVARVAAVEQAVSTSTQPGLQQQSQECTPLLMTKVVKAHAARITSILVLKDQPDAKSVVTASLDKTLLRMRLTQPASELHSYHSDTLLGSQLDAVDPASQVNRHLHLTRLQAPGGPVFSMVKQPKPAPGSIFDPNAKVLYIGNASKEVVAWEVKPWQPELGPCDANFQTVATDYTGWVRAMALSGKWLFSCGCNYLLVHDTSYPIPQEVSKQQLFKGDIQAMAANSSHVYVASADGVLRAFSINKQGKLTQEAQVSVAHDNRICDLTLHGSTLYSVGLDGWLKAWNADTLQLLAAVPDAHEGAKVHAVTVGPDGLLYTGGDDKLIRCWRPLSPALDFIAQLEHKNGHRPPTPLSDLPPVGSPLAGHEAGVRILAAGSSECLVSGDSEGDVCIWALPPRQTLQ